MIEKSLAGPIGLFIKFSTLQDHGIDKVFFLENDNVDASQKNIIFLARGEKANQPIAIAGMYVLPFLIIECVSSCHCLRGSLVYSLPIGYMKGQKVDYVDFSLLYIISLDPNINKRRKSSSIYSGLLRSP